MIQKMYLAVLLSLITVLTGFVIFVAAHSIIKTIMRGDWMVLVWPIGGILLIWAWYGLVNRYFNE